MHMDSILNSTLLRRRHVQINAAATRIPIAEQKVEDLMNVKAAINVGQPR